MKPILFVLCFFFYLSSQGQVKVDEFQNQISRTPFLNWEYVYPDSSSAYQDTIEGIQRYFWSKKGEKVHSQNIIYAYDYQAVIEGSIARDVHRDWNSFGLDSIYAHNMLFQNNPNIGDSINRFTDTILGSAWNEDYVQEDRMVIFEDMFLRVDFGFEPPLLVLSYLKETVDTADYELKTTSTNSTDVDEDFDFSGTWIGRVTRYTFDIPGDSFTYLEHQDSMLQVHFSSLDTGGYQMLPDTVWEEGLDWKTTFSHADNGWNVNAEYFNPDWSTRNRILSDHQDSIYYLIVVDPIQIDAFEMDLNDDEEFGWIWLFYRIKGIKEE